MANPGNPQLSPAGGYSAVGSIPDDNFGQRIGIGLAVSIGVNLALFAGASLMAREKPVPIDNGPVLVSPLTPTAAPTPAPTPSLTPAASPTPKVATPAPKPSPTPIVRASATPRPVVQPTPRAVVRPTPRPATPVPVTTPPPTVVKPQPTVATPPPIKPAIVKNITTSMIKDPTIATPPPSVQRELSTYRATNPNQPKLGSRSGTTLTPRAFKTSTATATIPGAAGGGSAGSAGVPSRGVAASDNRRAGAAGAIGSGPSALNPIVVAPIAESTISGSTRQLKTVNGTAGRIAGSVGVVALSAKASAASDSSFVVAGGTGSLRAGTVTARQGSAAGAGATAMSGAPSVISNGAEYTVSAPGAPDRGPIGVRGNKNSLIGTSVTALQSKGNAADVGAGVAVYGDAPGGSQRGAAGRKAVAAAGQAGVLSAVGGDGIGVVGNAGTGEGGAGRATGTGVKGSGGTGIRAANVGGGGAGGKVAGGSGDVYGDPNGVPGGAVRVNVATNTTKAGEAKVDTRKAVAVDTKVIKNIDTIQTKGPEELKFDEIDEIATDKAVTQTPARASSKPTWDPPNIKYSGVVEVRVTINADGSHSEDIKSTGVGELDSYLNSFFSKWRWEPGKLDGKPVKTVKTIRFHIN